MELERVDYADTFITAAPDCAALVGTPPPERSGSSPTVAGAAYELLAAHPYELTSGDVIFTVWAGRRGVPDDDRAAARREFYAVPRACLRSSDLAKRYGWGIHADAAGRLAIYGVETGEYRALAAGASPIDGRPVEVRAALRGSRARPT